MTSERNIFVLKFMNKGTAVNPLDWVKLIGIFESKSSPFNKRMTKNGHSMSNYITVWS